MPIDTARPDVARLDPYAFLAVLGKRSSTPAAGARPKRSSASAISRPVSGCSTSAAAWPHRHGGGPPLRRHGDRGGHLAAGEVQHVVAALRRGGITVVSLHNHALDDHPRLFYTHFWATGNGVTLAKALRVVLNQTNIAR